MDIRPLIITALLLIAFVAAVVALPVTLLSQMLNPAERTSEDDDRWD